MSHVPTSVPRARAGRAVRNAGTGRASALAALLAALGLAGTSHAQPEPADCNSPSIGASLAATVAPGDIIPPGQSVIPGQQITYFAGVFVSPNPPPPSTIKFCDVVGGQLSVTLPDWHALGATLVEVAGYPGTPDVTQFGNTTGPFVAQVPLTYTVDPEDVDAGGHLNARVDFGQTSYLTRRGVGQDSGMVLTDPIQDGNADTSSSIPVSIPEIRVTKSADVTGLCDGVSTPVQFAYVVENPGEAPLTNVQLSDSLCPPVYIDGDDGDDGILDRGEVWIYTCATSLSGSSSSTATARAVAIAFNGVVIDAIEYSHDDTLSIPGFPAPALSTSAASASACQGQSHDFCATVDAGTAPYTIEWRDEAGQLLNVCGGVGPGGSCCLTVDQAGSYFATAFDINGCADTAQVTFEVDAPPSLLVTPPAAVCPGGSQQFCAAPSGGQAPYTYAWNGPGGFTAGSACITASLAGDYCVTVTDANGCGSAMACTALSINDSPAVGVDPPAAGLCAGQSQTLCADASFGAAPYDFQWSGPGGFSAAEQCIDVTEPGDYCVIVTDGNLCVSAQSCAAVTLNENPTATVDPPLAQVCDGETASFTASPTGGQAPYAYAWTGPGGFTSDQATIIVGEAGDYCLTVTDANGCAADTACTTLEFGGNFTCALNGPAAVCEAAAVQYCGPAGLAGYEWSILGAASIVKDEGSCITIMPAGAGSYTVQLTATDEVGCECTSELTVQVGNGPTLALEVDETCVAPDPSQMVSVELRLADVAAAGLPIAAYQAFVSWDTDLFAFMGVTFTFDPFGNHLPIQFPAAGTIGLSATLTPDQDPTLEDALLATLQFAPITNGTCASENFDFTTTLNSANLLTGLDALPIQPCLAKSAEVLIDGEPPVIETCCKAMVIDADANCQAVIPSVIDCPELTITDACSGTGPGSAPLSVSQFPKAGGVIGKGITGVTIIATDCAGNMATCQVLVDVQDNTPPVVDCPSDRTLKVGDDCLTRVPDLRGQVSADDNCDNPTLLTIEQTPAPDAEIGLGVHVVTITVTDDDGNETTCEVTLTVIDAKPPKIICPGAQDVEGDESCQATVPDLTGQLTAFDNCTALLDLIVTQSPAPGTPLDPGTHEVTITVMDGAGSVSDCVVELTVVDGTPPILDCPATWTLALDGACQADIPDLTGEVTASDSCGDVEITQDPAQGGFLGVGTTTVTITATNEAGLSTSCDIALTTVDDEPPAVSCDQTFKLPADENCQAIVPQIVPEASDNCTVSGNLIITQSPRAGAPITMLGRTTVTFTVADESGNVGTCQTTLTVTDETAPEIECPDNIVTDCEGPDGAIVKVQPDVADNCDPDPEVNCFILDESGMPGGLVNPTGTLFPKGRTVVLCRATDKAKNMSFCLLTVSVIDTSEPDIQCPATLPFDITSADCEFDLPDLRDQVTVGDPCGDVDLAQNPPAGSRIDGPGITLVTFTATDKSGNSAQCKTTVLLTDARPPDIDVCPAAVAVKADGFCRGQVPDFRVGILAEDGCDGDLLIEQSPAPSTFVPVGVTVVTITVTDAAGNSAQCTVDFSVIDETAPIIQGCGNPVQLDADADCEAKVPDMTAGLNIGDQCWPIGQLTVEQRPPAGAVVGAGTHGVTITVTDPDGNTTSCVRSLIVHDVTPPVVACPATIQETAPADVCLLSLELEDPEAEDACDEDDVEIAGVRDDGQALAAPFPVGTTTITWTATDQSGNASSCAQTVTVLDQTAPTISCPGTISVDAVAGTCQADVDPGVATARDSCDPLLAVSGTRPDGLDLDDPYPTGTTTITWSATDDSGNVATCTQKIIVSNDHRMVVDLELAFPAAAEFERCITFELFSFDPPQTALIEEEIDFVNGVARNVVIDVPCGANWHCVTAQDRLHTLRRQAFLQPSGPDELEADFTGDNGLIGGDLDDDGSVSVLDFLIYSTQFGMAFSSGDSECGDNDPAVNANADINGDGMVNAADGNIISAALLTKDDPDCAGGGLAMAGPDEMAGAGGFDAERDRVSRFDGLEGASWFAAGSWTAGRVPDAGVEVEVDVTVEVDRTGAIARRVVVESGGRLVVSTGSLELDEIVVEAGGSLSVDADRGSLTTGSMIVEPGGTVHWQGGGARPFAADQAAVTITGEAHLAGALVVTLPGGFRPRDSRMDEGQAFVIVAAARAFGRFESLDLPSPGPGRRFAIAYDRDRVVLSVLPASEPVSRRP